MGEEFLGSALQKQYLVHPRDKPSRFLARVRDHQPDPCLGTGPA